MTSKMLMVRVYILEAEKQLQPILHYLHDVIQVRGVTVFRGITGFGQSKVMHTNSLLDLSLNLPITVEFFDSDDRVQKVITHLNTIVEPGHIATWPIEVNCSS